MAPDFASLIEDAARAGRGLAPDDARALLAAMLADTAAPRELAAIRAAWRERSATPSEMSGFLRALHAHAGRLETQADGSRPVVLPAYHGTLRQPNLTALIALLLRRYGLVVLVHGLAGGDAAVAGATDGPVATADVLRELGILPAVSLADAQARLAYDRIAYVPTAVLAPGLARLLAPAPADSPPWPPARALAKLLDPFGGEGFRVAGAAPAEDLAAMRDSLTASGAHALLFPGTEGEPFADPHRQQPFTHFAAGVATVCGEDEDTGAEPALPATRDAPTTAAWIAGALAGSEPVPPAIITQLGCCLNGARRLGAAA